MKVRIEPARQASENRAIDEHLQLCRSRANTESFSHHRPATQCTDCSSEPPSQKVARRNQSEDHDDPHHDEILSHIDESAISDLQWRNARKAVIGAEPSHITQKIEKRR